MYGFSLMYSYSSCCVHVYHLSCIAVLAVVHGLTILYYSYFISCVHVYLLSCKAILAVMCRFIFFHAKLLQLLCKDCHTLSCTVILAGMYSYSGCYVHVFLLSCTVILAVMCMFIFSHVHLFQLLSTDLPSLMYSYSSCYELF